MKGIDPQAYHVFFLVCGDQEWKDYFCVSFFTYLLGFRGDTHPNVYLTLKHA